MLFFNRSISRTESCVKMDDGDFIIKMIDSDIIYREFYKRKPSLEYLSNQIQNVMNYKVFKPKDLKDNHNETFNELFNDLDEDKQDSIKENKQLAFLCFRKKDGSFDRRRTIVIELKSLSKGEHTEDEIFKLLLDIYNESKCDYSEIYIFSTNSPCLARKDCVPCMIRAFVIAELLNKKHGIKTVTGYIINYGLNGSYDNNVPFYPIKDCIYTFDSQTLRSKDLISASSHPRKKQKHTKVNTEYLIPVYTQIIAEEQNSTFSMKVTVSTPPFNLQKSFPEISNSEIYNQLNEIKQNLFKDPKLDKKSFDDFHAYGLEMFEKYTNEIHDLLIDYDENIYKNIRKHLQTRFFPWWAKNLDEASGNYLNEKLSQNLQNYALHLFILEIEEMQKKIGRQFFEIGLVTLN